LPDAHSRLGTGPQAIEQSCHASSSFVFYGCSQGRWSKLRLRADDHVPRPQMPAALLSRTDVAHLAPPGFSRPFHRVLHRTSADQWRTAAFAPPPTSRHPSDPGPAMVSRLPGCQPASPRSPPGEPSHPVPGPPVGRVSRRVRLSHVAWHAAPRPIAGLSQPVPRISPARRPLSRAAAQTNSSQSVSLSGTRQTIRSELDLQFWLTDSGLPRRAA